MSIEALNWAFDLPIEPRAKLTLIAICNYANDEGRAWPKINTLAAKTTQSPKTIQRRLAVLEALGVFTRVHRYREDGSRTSDEIRLHMDLLPEHILTGADVDEDAELEADQDLESVAESATISDAESISGPRSTSPGVGTAESGGAGHSSPGIEPSLEPNLTPKPLSSCDRPPSEASEAPRLSASHSENKTRDLDGLEEFKAAYGMPSNRPGRVEDLWCDMTAEERKLATLGAHGVSAARRSGKIKNSLSQEKFLADPKVQREFAGGSAAAAASSGFATRVLEGSQAWADWLVAYRVRGYREPPQFVLTFDSVAKCRALHVPSEFPPLVRGQPAFDPAVWVFVPLGDQRRNAWNARIFEAFGSNIKFTERHTLAPVGDERIGKKLEGNWFPCEWPPSKAAEQRAIDEITKS